MQEKLTLARAEVKDWKDVGKFEKKIDGKWYPAFTKEEDLRKYIHESHAYFIVLDEKRIGTVSYHVKDKESVYLDGLTLLPELQGKGLGEQACGLFFMKLGKYKKITAAIHPENILSQKIAFKFGLRIIGWKDNYFGDGEPRLLLALSRNGANRKFKFLNFEVDLEKKNTSV